MNIFRLRTNDYAELVDFKIWCISNHPEFLSKLVNPFDMNKREFASFQKSLSRDKFKNVNKRYKMYVAPYKTIQEAIAAFKNVSGNSSLKAMSTFQNSNLNRSGSLFTMHYNGRVYGKLGIKCAYLSAC